MTITLGLIVEGAVAVLLILTIGYCFILNDKLKKLHADRDALKQMVSDLMQATNMANSAIKGLRETAEEADGNLRSRLEEADRFGVELANHINAGRSIMDRIARLTEAAKRSPDLASAVPAAKSDGSAQSALDRLAALQKRRENAA